MTLAVALIVGAALFVLGLVALAARRSLVGALVGVQLSCGGLIVLACALFDLTGAQPSEGQVIAAAVIAFAAGTAVLLVAIHLAAERASRSAEDLEPW